jgi:hypothetical protein
MLRTIAIVSIAAAALSGCGEPVAEKLSPGHDAALAYFKSGKEAQVKDAVWASSMSFKVGVRPDKGSKDGYAQYVCAKLKDFIPDTSMITVRVIDIVVLVQKDQWKTIGEADCGRYQKQ